MRWDYQILLFQKKQTGVKWSLKDESLVALNIRKIIHVNAELNSLFDAANSSSSDETYLLTKAEKVNHPLVFKFSKKWSVTGEEKYNAKNLWTLTSNLKKRAYELSDAYQKIKG